MVDMLEHAGRVSHAGYDSQHVGTLGGREKEWPVVAATGVNDLCFNRACRPDRPASAAMLPARQGSRIDR